MADNRFLIGFGFLFFLVAICAPGATYDDEVVQAYAECVEGVIVGPEIEVVPPACLTAAEAGIPGAQYLMGEILYSLDPEANLVSAVDWFSRASANGHPAAIFTLGLFQVQGLGVEENKTEGFKNLQIAICSGYPQAITFAQQVELDVECSPAGKNNVSSGTWEGQLEAIFRPPFEFAVSPNYRFRLEFAEGGPKVFRFSKEKTWEEVKPGGFQASELGPSAVVSSIDDGWDFDGRWVETWMFTLTSNPDETATVVWTRQVNNVHVSREDPHATFTIVAKGEFSRAAPGQ